MENGITNVTIRNKYEFLKGKHSEGNMLGDEIQTDDVNVCINKCESDSACVGVTYLYEPNKPSKCHTNRFGFYHSVQFPKNIKKDKYVDTYSKKVIAQKGVYDSLQNTDSTGNDISSSKLPTSTDCLIKCDNTADCRGFAYKKSSQMCYIKNKGMYPTGTKVARNGFELFWNKSAGAKSAPPQPLQRNSPAPPRNSPAPPRISPAPPRISPAPPRISPAPPPQSMNRSPTIAPPPPSIAPPSVSGKGGKNSGK